MTHYRQDNCSQQISQIKHEKCNKKPDRQSNPQRKVTMCSLAMNEAYLKNIIINTQKSCQNTFNYIYLNQCADSILKII